jgi:hypothetical protein
MGALSVSEIEALDGTRLADQLVHAVLNEDRILQSISLWSPCSDLTIDQALALAAAHASTRSAPSVPYWKLVFQFSNPNIRKYLDSLVAIVVVYENGDFC